QSRFLLEQQFAGADGMLDGAVLCLLRELVLPVQFLEKLPRAGGHVRDCGRLGACYDDDPRRAHGLALRAAASSSAASARVMPKIAYRRRPSLRQEAKSVTPSALSVSRMCAGSSSGSAILSPRCRAAFPCRSAARVSRA